MNILAIESSCDETSVAVVENGTVVLSNIIASSQAAFKASGGVIPEEAARKQVEAILPVLHLALEPIIGGWNAIDAIAVTKGPGLLGSLLVGTVTGRALASMHHKPLIGVHHTLGHLSSTWLMIDPSIPPAFPILTLSASGGHTELWLRTSHTHGELIGRTIDDAAGEAFDKGATLLGLPYPGGPSISKAAEIGNIDAFPFTMPLKKEDTLNFSFSGLKTNLRYTIRDLPKDTLEAQSSTLEASLVADLAASFQSAICLHLVDRIKKALTKYPDIQEVHAVGGVSANTHLRSLITDLTSQIPHLTVRFPKTLAFCTDNAAMIASAAYFLSQEEADYTQKFETSASLPLTSAIRV
jgi:N6-L-threonylcarbamoyladenine synthase